MKNHLIGLTIFLTTTAMAQDLRLTTKNWPMTDIASKNLTKEGLYNKMNRNPLRTSDSICSNRAQFWTYDFKRQYNLDTGKLFLFYSKSNSAEGRKHWWYHVTPYIIENGQEWTMDAGFPGMVDSPLTIRDWFLKFSHSTICKEITAQDEDLIGQMVEGFPMPDYYKGQFNRCYYIKVPSTYWTPGSIAEGLTGLDHDGRQVSVSRTQFDFNELAQSCEEVVTSKWNKWSGEGRDICNKYFKMTLFKEP